MSRSKAPLCKLPSVRRAPLYLRVLYELKARGREVVSSAHLTRESGVEQIVVKKDLEMTGIRGKTGVGYDVEELIAGIEEFLGWRNATDAFLVGAGHLGSALLNYEGFRHYGLKLIAAFDNDPKRIGREMAGVPVFSIERLPELALRMHIHLAVLTVPAAAAQAVTNTLVAAGVRGIWNFTPVKLEVPETVIVHREDLAAGLAELSVKLKHLLGKGEPDTETDL